MIYSNTYRGLDELLVGVRLPHPLRHEGEELLGGSVPAAPNQSGSELMYYKQSDS